jgi:hypothetical protein
LPEESLVAGCAWAAGPGLDESVELDCAHAHVATAALSAVDNINFFSIFVSSFSHKMIFTRSQICSVITTRGMDRRSLFGTVHLFLRAEPDRRVFPKGALTN